jgi:hypothetical protein
MALINCVGERESPDHKVIFDVASFERSEGSPACLAMLSLSAAAFRATAAEFLSPANIAPIRQSRLCAAASWSDAR